MKLFNCGPLLTRTDNRPAATVIDAVGTVRVMYALVYRAHATTSNSKQMKTDEPRSVAVVLLAAAGRTGVDGRVKGELNSLES
jgi:hypothetical protein